MSSNTLYNRPTSRVCFFCTFSTKSKNRQILTRYLETGLIPRFWANKKIDELKLFPEIKENEKAILDVSLYFGLHTHRLQARTQIWHCHTQHFFHRLGEPRPVFEGKSFYFFFLFCFHEKREDLDFRVHRSFKRVSSDFLFSV